ncbi:MAG: sugar transporter [Helicobacteraceae bacterium]|jgi:DHA1 family L-arabinose/isopropyl-beta-D-thiogalactopyranoside export protein-like MFS transporter|nr:sugar transporter [Helicobacteraceae bacterium]
MRKITSWLAVASLSFSAFIFNTTELAPVGLLTAISDDFNMDSAYTGYMVTIYAWTVAALSLPLTVLTAKIERKRLLTALFIVFIASHLLIGAAQSFEVLIVGRLGVACAHAIFWSITVPLAVRLAPEESKSKAIGALVAGGSVAMVLGVPIGTAIGQAFGWRVTFFIIAAIALLALLAITKLLPALPCHNAGNFKSLPILFKRASVVWIYVLIAVIVTGEFTAYTYIGAFLEAKGYERSVVAWLLLVGGGAGLLSSYLFGLWGDRFANLTLIVPLALLAAMLALLEASAINIYAVFFLSFAWGLFVVMIFMSLQSRLLSAAKDAADVANAIYSGIFNVGIGGGAYVGSLVSLSFSVSFVGYAGSLIVCFGLALCAAYLTRVSQKSAFLHHSR